MSANKTDYRAMIDEVIKQEEIDPSENAVLSPAVQELKKFLKAAQEAKIIDEIKDVKYKSGRREDSCKISFNFAGHAAREKAFVENKKPNKMNTDASISVRRAKNRDGGQFVIGLNTNIKLPADKDQYVRDADSLTDLAEVFSRHTKNLIALQIYYRDKTEELASAQKQMHQNLG